MADKNDTALSKAEEMDPSSLRAFRRRVDQNSAVITTMVDRLVAEYCEPLDNYMKYCKEVVGDPNNPPTDAELEQFVLNLPVLLYFTGEAQESLGIKEDIAKAIRQELFSEAYAKADGTIGDKTAVAELATQLEFVTQSAYQRAYKKIKLRMESANEMLQSVKKVVSRRMSEYDLSKVDPGRIGGV